LWPLRLLALKNGARDPARASGASSRLHYYEKDLRKIGKGSPSANFVAELARVLGQFSLQAKSPGQVL